MNQYCLISLKTIGYSSSRMRISEICLGLIIDGRLSLELHEYIKHDSLLKRGHVKSDAKYFYEVAKRVVELTKDKVLVAEDAYLECTFLKKEFLSIGYSFNVKTLSLKNFLPEIDSKEMGSCTAKIDLMYARLNQVLNDDSLCPEVKRAQRKIPTPAHFDDSVLEQLPSKPGVYFFKDNRDQIIYVGKAKDLSKRVPQHFSFDPERSKHLEFKSVVSTLEYEVCSSENEAILLEIYLIKKWVPIFNRTLKTRRFNFGIFYNQEHQQYICRRFQESECPIRSVRSKRSAQRFIDYFERENLKPCDLDFQDPKVMIPIAPQCVIEIHQKRYLHWKHSPPLDLNDYPEMKGELIKVLKKL